MIGRQVELFLLTAIGSLGRSMWRCRRIVYPFARFRLARHYAKRDQRELAQNHYLAFLDTFTQPDPEFAWMVTEARTELARMSEER